MMKYPAKQVKVIVCQISNKYGILKVLPLLPKSVLAVFRRFALE